jgi:tetratricopeptide (TPR) repeat protein
LSLALFIYAGYLFINPGPGATLDQKIAVAKDYLKQNRPDAALQQLDRILETERLEPAKEGPIHALIAQALEAGQKQQRIDVPANHQRIIEQTELALQMGVNPDADMHRRLGDSYAALDRGAEAAQHYRQAIAMDPHQSLSLRRKLIELELADDDLANADESLAEYLKQPELTDVERAWALDQRAAVLIDRKQFVEARKLLANATRLDSDPVDQGTYNYQLGYCAWPGTSFAWAIRWTRTRRIIWGGYIRTGAMPRRRFRFTRTCSIRIPSPRPRRWRCWAGGFAGSCLGKPTAG